LCRQNPPSAEDGREFWRRVLLAGGVTAIPRWTVEPVPGIGEHEARLPGELAAALRRLANEVAVPLGSVLLTAHAKVIAAVSGEREIAIGYAVTGRPALPCRLTTAPRSWRELLHATHRAESELLSHVDFPLADLRRELGCVKPLFETVFELVGADTRVGPYAGGRGELAEETVLQVGFVEHDELLLQLRYKTDV